VIPLVGHAISRGQGEPAFALIAFFIVLAAALNIRRAGSPVTGHRAGTTHE